MRILTALGAYGRSAHITDWLDGKDFRVYDGPYFSIRDKEALKAEGYTAIRFLCNRGFHQFTETL